MSNPFVSVIDNPFVQQSEEDRREYAARAQYDHIVSERMRNLSHILDMPLRPGQQYRIVTTHAVNAVVVLELLDSLYEINEMWLAIYRMNRQAVRRIASMIISTGADTHIILSSFFRENKKYEKWCAELKAFCNTTPNAEIVFLCSHAKILLVRTTCGRYIVFEGSGNLSDNARIEQYMIEDNELMYKFHADWMASYFSGAREGRETEESP